MPPTGCELWDGKKFPAIKELRDQTGKAVLGSQSAAEADAAALTAVAVAGSVPAGGVGAAAGGWDTAGNRDTAITTIGEMKTTINALRADVSALRTVVNSLLAKLRTHGIIAT